MKNIHTPLDFQYTGKRKLSFLTQIKVLFGGSFLQIGALFFWFGLVCSSFFVLESELVNWFKFDGAWQSTTGVFQETLETGASVNDQSVYQYYFSYNVDGQSYQGYSSGVSLPANYNIGEEVPIEFKEGNINRARIVGMREKTFSSWIAFVLIFPLVGAGLYFTALISNYKALRLLKIGKVAFGRLLRSTATNTSINEETVYKYEFGFEVDGRSYVAVAKTHLTAGLEDEDTEMILYNANNPDDNLVYDSVSSINKLDIRGNVPKAGINALLYPLSTLIGLAITTLILLVYL